MLNAGAAARLAHYVSAAELLDRLSGGSESCELGAPTVDRSALPSQACGHASGLSSPMSSSMSAARPRVLFVYYTVSQQTLRVIEAMTDTLRREAATYNRRGSSLPTLATPIGFRVSHSSILTSLWPGCFCRSCATRPDRYASRTRCEKVITTLSASGRQRGG